MIQEQQRIKQEVEEMARREREEAEEAQRIALKEREEAEQARIELEEAIKRKDEEEKIK
jgi:hypothetical protein